MVYSAEEDCASVSRRKRRIRQTRTHIVLFITLNPRYFFLFSCNKTKGHTVEDCWTDLDTAKAKIDAAMAKRYKKRGEIEKRKPSVEEARAYTAVVIKLQRLERPPRSPTTLALASRCMARVSNHLHPRMSLIKQR